MVGYPQTRSRGSRGAQFHQLPRLLPESSQAKAKQGHARDPHGREPGRGRARVRLDRHEDKHKSRVPAVCYFPATHWRTRATTDVIESAVSVPDRYSAKVEVGLDGGQFRQPVLTRWHMNKRVRPAPGPVPESGPRCRGSGVEAVVGPLRQRRTGKPTTGGVKSGRADSSAKGRVQTGERAPGPVDVTGLEKLSTMQMVDVHVPTTDRRHLVLPRRTEPTPDQQLLLHQLDLRLPEQPPPRLSV